MINCKEATQLLSLRMDQPLGLKQRSLLRFHLMMCSGCRHFGQHMGDLRQLSQRYMRGEDKK